MASSTLQLGVQVLACSPGSSPQEADNKPRRRRTLTKKDPLMSKEKRECFYWETSYRQFKDEGKRVLLHADWLLARGNRYGVTLKIAKAAEEFQRNNKEEARSKNPVLKAIGEEINKEFGHGKIITDAYTEDVVDYSKYLNSPLEDPEEEIEIPGPRTTNSFDWCERTEWKGKDSGDPGWRTKIKRKDIVWLPVQDNTQVFRMF